MYTQFYGDSYTDTLILIGIIAAFTLLVLLALVVTQVVLAILVAFQLIEYEPFLVESLRRLMISSYHEDARNLRSFWDSVQQELSCCGSSGPLDWSDSFGSVKEIGIGASEIITAQ